MSRWALAGVDPKTMRLEIIATATPEHVDDHLVEIEKEGCVPLITSLDIAKTYWGRKVTVSKLLAG